MKKQAWNWLNAIVLTFVAGTIANVGYLLLQEKHIERGDWGWFIAGQACLIVTGLKKLWDDSGRSRNAADGPELAIGQGPKEADTD